MPFFCGSKGSVLVLGEGTGVIFYLYCVGGWVCVGVWDFHLVMRQRRRQTAQCGPRINPGCKRDLSFATNPPLCRRNMPGGRRVTGQQMDTPPITPP